MKGDHYHYHYHYHDNDNDAVNEKIGVPGSKPPDDHTWHYVQDEKNIRLIPQSIHNSPQGGFPRAGGYLMAKFSNMTTIRTLSRTAGSSEFSLENINLGIKFFCEQKLEGRSNFPDSLGAFIEKYNGGSFDECISLSSPIGPLVVALFLPLTGTVNSIEVAFDYFHQEVSADLIPFALDPGGNYFLLGYAKSNWNEVYFWDHENDKLTLIDKTFEYFLNSLVLDE